MNNTLIQGWRERVKIGSGHTDKGAQHRAMMVGKAMHDAGMWDSSQHDLTLYDPYHLHDNMCFGLDATPVTELVKGVHYDLLPATPFGAEYAWMNEPVEKPASSELEALCDRIITGTQPNADERDFYAVMAVGQLEIDRLNDADLCTAMIDLGDKRGMSDQDFYDTLSRWKANLDSVVDDDVNLVSAPISDEPKHEEVAAALVLAAKLKASPVECQPQEYVTVDKAAYQKLEAEHAGYEVIARRLLQIADMHPGMAKVQAMNDLIADTREYMQFLTE